MRLLLSPHAHYMFGDAALNTKYRQICYGKFMKIDTRHENIGKIHPKGLHQPEKLLIKMCKLNLG